VVSKQRNGLNPLMMQWQILNSGRRAGVVQVVSNRHNITCSVSWDQPTTRIM
jgi:hypothetical protein